MKRGKRRRIITRVRTLLINSQIGAIWSTFHDAPVCSTAPAFCTARAPSRRDVSYSTCLKRSACLRPHAMWMCGDHGRHCFASIPILIDILKVSSIVSGRGIAPFCYLWLDWRLCAS
jgi:hypothetical protein